MTKELSKFEIKKESKVVINNDPYFWNIEILRISKRFKKCEMALYIYDSEKDFLDKKKNHIDKKLFIYSDNNDEIANFNFSNYLSKEKLSEENNYLTKHLEDYINENKSVYLAKFNINSEVVSE